MNYMHVVTITTKSREFGEEWIKELEKVPYEPGFEMKSLFIRYVLAATNTSAPISLLRLPSISVSCGLKSEAACISSTAHSPARLRWASSAGRQPIGLVPVTMTFLAPNSCSFCNSEIFFLRVEYMPIIVFPNFIFYFWLKVRDIVPNLRCVKMDYKKAYNIFSKHQKYVFRAASASSSHFKNYGVQTKHSAHKEMLKQY